MKKSILILCLVFCTFLVFAQQQKKMYVTAESVELKQKNSMSSKTLETLTIGDVVYVSQERGNWSYVTTEDSGTSGWISSNVLTRKKVVAKGDKVSANTSELALAGKGFSAEVEESYKQVVDLDFDLVDTIELNAISFDDVILFMQDGNLEATE